MQMDGVGGREAMYSIYIYIYNMLMNINGLSGTIGEMGT